jgi:hypothetical protein
MVTEWLLYFVFWRATVPVLVPTAYETEIACHVAGEKVSKKQNNVMPINFYCVEVTSK